MPVTRRRWFQSLLAAVLVPLVAPSQARPAARRVLIQRSPLAGFQYHHGEALWRRLRVGHPLALEREADNPYDDRAVRIDWKGRKLGYLPRMENTAVSQMLDRGERLTARITALGESHDPWLRVAIEVWLEPQA